MTRNVARLQKRLRGKLPDIVRAVNGYLFGRDQDQIVEFIKDKEWQRKVKKWLGEIAEQGRPVKSNSKSLGTYLEKIIRAEMSRALKMDLSGSSGRGVDVRELEINLKVTSNKNPQSSEPFESPYQRILGSVYDLVVFIYNGKEIVGEDIAHLKILSFEYLNNSQVADKVLCDTALLVQRLAQSDHPVVSENTLKRCLKVITYTKKGAGAKSAKLVYFRNLEAALRLKLDPKMIEDAVQKGEEKIAENVEASPPSPSEWKVFLNSPLDGKIGISFALQWRYKFQNPKE